MPTVKREQIGSRLGFILLSAGCAIGLGNVWRFPYITGEYGGAAFILIYLFFLLFLGLPIMVMEFAVGRGAQRNIAVGFKILQPNNPKWSIFGHVAMFGTYMLLMFYTTVSGWMLAYCYHMATGDLSGLSVEEIGKFFEIFLSNPWRQVGWMAIVVTIGTAVCSIGLQKGVEKASKWMMSILLFVMLVLAIRSVTLEGAGKGLEFYLMPDLDKILEKGIWETIYVAMGQAFFTLSLGIGSMAIMGSYLGKERSLTGESLNILLLDTFVGLMAGLIIFPAAFAFNIDPGAGPSLIFITLPNIFDNMQAGQLWGTLFFIFMSFAALTTIIAVFENVASYGIDVFHLSRKKSIYTQGFLLFILSIPCALGFSVLSDFQPLGPGSNVLDLEDFIVSNNLLPLGSMVFLFFCCYRSGWGWDNFVKEANTGKGLKYPVQLYYYIKYVLPCIVFFVFVQGYLSKFF